MFCARVRSRPRKESLVEQYKVLSLWEGEHEAYNLELVLSLVVVKFPYLHPKHEN